MNVETKQQRIAELAKQYSQVGLNNLHHYMDVDWLKEAYRRLDRQSAPGIDGQSAEQYGEELESNLRDLLNRAKGKTYRAPPVRRGWVPKDEKESRPIGMPTVEDKVLQRAVVMVLEPMYEEEFYDFSFGFRPGRSAHQALEYLWQQFRVQKVEWVVDVDVRKFFDTLDHVLLRNVLRRKVQDGVLLWLVDQWLKAGVMEGGHLSRSVEGTPQGGVISPLLSHIFLHEALDQWFAEVVQCRLRGRSCMIRYADDMVMGFELEEDARRVMDALPKRLGKYGLSLHPQKTRLVRFRRPPLESETFEFLGFTHYWGKSRKGWNVVRRKTARTRFKRALKRFAQWAKQHRHDDLQAQHRMVCAKLRGHYGYYGITGNGRSLTEYFERVKKCWRGWLNRRSRSADGMSWERFGQLLKEHLPLPKPKVVHSIYAANPSH